MSTLKDDIEWATADTLAYARTLGRRLRPPETQWCKELYDAWRAEVTEEARVALVETFRKFGRTLPPPPDERAHAQKVAPWFVGLDELLGPPRPEWKPSENPAGLVCEASVACDRASQALDLLVRYATHKAAQGMSV